MFFAFATVVVAFVTATLYANWRALEIGREARDVSTNALPSIEHLTAASDALRDIEIASIAYAQLPQGDSAAASLIQRKWEEVDRDLVMYLRLPAFNGERELYGGLPAKLRTLSDSLRDLFDAVEDADPAALRTSTVAVSAASEAATADLHSLVRFNTSHAYESAMRIDAVHGRATALALVLNGIVILVAIAATARVWVLFRVHTRLLREHGRLVELRASELEVFGKRVAHDLVSPLSALTYCLSAFKRASESDPGLRDAMEKARACVLRAQTMVNGVFEFSRAGGQPEPGATTLVREVVEQVADEVCASELHERPNVVIECADDCKVACSRGVLMSILTNLMRNAAKYMSDSPVRQIVVKVSSADAMVRFDVRDTGPGIAPELQRAVFEPYVRAADATQPGLGLGLTTVKRLCDAHRGAVGVESMLGRGALFWFTLPSVSSPAAQPATKPNLRLIG
jgi:signal transduction histidine kinase